MEEIQPQNEIVQNNNKNKKLLEMISIVLMITGLCLFLIIFNTLISLILFIIGFILYIFNSINFNNKTLKIIYFFTLEMIALLFFALLPLHYATLIFESVIFIGVGLITLIFSIKSLIKKERNILIWLLLLSSLFFYIICASDDYNNKDKRFYLSFILKQCLIKN
jgi:hypothetical protein